LFFPWLYKKSAAVSHECRNTGEARQGAATANAATSVMLLHFEPSIVLSSCNVSVIWRVVEISLFSSDDTF
jgi:hypothetical protein